MRKLDKKVQREIIISSVRQNLLESMKGWGPTNHNKDQKNCCDLTLISEKRMNQALIDCGHEKMNFLYTIKEIFQKMNSVNPNQENVTSSLK